MQIKIKFTSDKDIILPISYNHVIQGFIYNNIDKDLANFLHNEGYINKNRNFKLFTFSRILNIGRIDGKVFNFGKEIEIIISSILDKFCKSIANTMLQSDDLYLGQNYIKANQIEIINEKIERDEVIVKTLSPIVTYSTFTRENGKKYTCYFEPKEIDFKRIVSENLIRKYNALYSKNLNFDNGVKIIPIGNYKMNISYYKDFLIKGYSGRFKIIGDKELLQLAIEVGLGSKNSQGFGCIEII